ncbi:hypothetical protein AC578_5907 [Pseudocercospora eumusae]|uniref:Uncharacterized protein n=1 Tax=Pseudocercospora eumusae TaxID=321146 RepID=A0A139HBF4_9PEZI|nr:hypothetical protein AC578_5907 [Pseudocercospora eumusae]
MGRFVDVVKSLLLMPLFDPILIEHVGACVETALVKTCIEIPLRTGCRCEQEQHRYGQIRSGDYAAMSTLALALEVEDVRKRIHYEPIASIVYESTVILDNCIR